MIGYWIALLAALLETTIGVGWLIPGSTIILLMGAMAAKGYFDLGDLLWFAAIGAVLGDNINYFIGKKYGSKIFTKGFWFIKPVYFKKGEKFFKRHGSKSIFIGRFIPSIKEIIPLVAGTFRMKRAPFMVWNILGAIGWSLVWVLPGYFFAQSLDFAESWLTRAGFFLTILFAVFVIFYFLKVIVIKKGKQFFSFSLSIWKSIKQAVIENQEARSFTGRHKKLFQFIRKRLDRNNFFGLPLTLFSLALLYTFSLFIGVVKNIINADSIVSADTGIAQLLAVFRNVEVTKFFLFITELGKSQIILVFALAAIGVLWIYRKRIYIGPLLLSIVGSETFTFLGKIVFHRPRPEAAVYAEKSFSFPSGHAAIAVAFYGFLAYMLIRNFGRWKTKVNIFFAGMLIILLIGFSRLYLGVHYFSDVWGGYLVGALWLIISISILEWLRSKKNYVDHASPPAKARLVSIALISVSLLFYAVYAVNYRPERLPANLRNKTVIEGIDDIFSDGHKYTETLTGKEQEPLSFIIYAKDDENFKEMFAKFGWYLADDADIHSVAKFFKAAVLKQEYLQAPMTPSFWNEQIHDFGFEKPTVSDNARQRHHARFWKTNYISKDGKLIYAGVASLDSGMKWGITHKINPDIDTEREFLFGEMKNAGVLEDYKKEKFVDPVLGQNFAGDQFFTDGQIYILRLRAY